MSLFLNRGRTQPKDGKPYPFWEVRETYWDPEVKATRQRYIGYIGKEPVITESKAREICEKKGLTLEQLRQINGLTIVPDEDEEAASNSNGKQQAFELRNTK